ncbi:Coiled-coil domain-containing protein 149-A [Trinorchestia longiramus]|nr:Coiled-coil domain-containing protein 149-A [Trinorchestia longiramus]
MPSTKKKCIDIPESLLLEIDNLKSEVQVLRRTVDSKCRAVVILRKQLASVKEHAGVQDDKEVQTDFKSKTNESGVGTPEHHHSSNNVLAELLSISKRENKALKQDILSLRCKLHDALADLKVVRSETPLLVAGGGGGVAAVSGPLQQQWQRQERLHLISQLEVLTDKVSTLTSDVRCLSADRDELLREREHSRITVARLSSALRAASAQPSDLPLPTGSGGSADHSARSSVSEVYREDFSSQHRSTSEKFRKAELEIARLKSVVADYELLASLQRASQHAPHLTLGSPHGGSEDDVKQTATMETSRNAPTAPASAVVQPEPLIQSSNVDGEEETGCVKNSEEQCEECSYAATNESSVEAQILEPQDLTSSKGVSDNDNPSLITVNCDQTFLALAGEAESLGEHSCFSQRTSSVSQAVQDSAVATLNCQNSIEELTDSDHKFQETRKWLSHLEKAERFSSHNRHFESDFPEEIVPIEQIGAPRRIDAALHTPMESPHSSSIDMNSSGECAIVTDNKPHPPVEASSGSVQGVTVSAPGAGKGYPHSEGFSDYDSDDDHFEAELNQWQKSAGALLCKAQKKDKM